MMFLIGLLVGVVQTGCLTARTIEIMRGHVMTTIVTGLVMCITFYTNTHFAISSMPGYIGVSIGSVLITTIMAYRNKGECNGHTKDNRHSGHQNR